MKTIHIYLFLALGLFSFTSQAQVKLQHIGAGVSYWDRTYSGDNERAFLIGYEGEGGFSKGAAVPYVTAEIGVWKNLGADVRIGLWSGKFENGARFGDGLVIEEEIKQTIIPVSLGALYRWEQLVNPRVDAYVGAGVNRYFLQNKVERTVYGDNASSTSDSFSGNSYGGYIKGGFEYAITQRFAFGIEGRYNLGSYNQLYQPTEDDTVQEYEISLQGLEVGLSLLYRFNWAAAAK